MHSVDAAHRMLRIVLSGAFVASVFWFAHELRTDSTPAFLLNDGMRASHRVDVPIGPMLYHQQRDLLFVSDIEGNRVLVYDGTTLKTAPEVLYVLGQQTVDGTISSTTRSGLANPSGLTLDPVRDWLFVSDEGNARVLVFALEQLATGQEAAFVLGQSTFTTNTPSPSDTGLVSPRSLAYERLTKRLFVADWGDGSVRIFDVATPGNGKAAIAVFGKESADAEVPQLQTRETLRAAAGLALDEERKQLFVSSDLHHRIMVFDVSTISNNKSASFVLGQPDYVTDAAGVSASALTAPQYLLYHPDEDHLYVADTGNNRVLAFDVSTIENGQDASFVIGQFDFDGQSVPTVTPADVLTPLSLPLAVSYDANADRLFVNTEDSLYVFTACGNAIVDEGEECDDGNTEENDGCSTLCEVTESVSESSSSESSEETSSENSSSSSSESSASSQLSFETFPFPDESSSSSISLLSSQSSSADSSSLISLISSISVNSSLSSSSDYSESSESSESSIAFASSVQSIAPTLVIDTCGDRILEESEECDDGNRTNGDGCSSRCRLESSAEEDFLPVIAPTEEPENVKPAAREPICGNALLDDGEECDTGDQNSDTVPNACRTACVLAYCGDGVVDIFEECDDSGASDTCSDTCTLSMDIDFSGSVCGNGIVEAFEQCDDGDLNSLSPDANCTPDCTLGLGAACGNGVRDVPEECDDGNRVSNDGCSSTCTNEPAPASVAFELPPLVSPNTVLPTTLPLAQLQARPQSEGTLGQTGPAAIAMLGAGAAAGVSWIRRRRK